MNSEEKKELGPLWLNLFDAYICNEYEDCVKQNDIFTAQNIFWTAWQQFKLACYKKGIILSKPIILELLSLIVPHKEIWLPLVDSDEDFLLFHQMEIRKKEEEEYSQANTYTRKQLDEESCLRVLIRQIMLKTASTLQLDRREFVFFEELKMLVNQISEDKIVCSPEKLKKLLDEEINGLPTYLLNMVDKLASRLPQEVKRRSPVEKPIEIEVISLPPLAKTLEPPPLVVHEPVVNFNGDGRPVIMMSMKQYEIDKEGVKGAIEALMPHFEPLDFYRKVKNLLNKIEVHCRDHHFLNQLLKIVHELKNEYYTVYNKDDKSPIGLKKGYIYSALGLFEASLSEKLAPFFKGSMKIK